MAGIPLIIIHLRDGPSFFINRKRTSIHSPAVPGAMMVAAPRGFLAATGLGPDENSDQKSFNQLLTLEICACVYVYIYIYIPVCVCVCTTWGSKVTTAVTLLVSTDSESRTISSRIHQLHREPPVQGLQDKNQSENLAGNVVGKFKA